MIYQHHTDMRLQNNLRPMLIACWSSNGQLSKPENGDYDKHNFSRSCVFNCDAVDEGQVAPVSLCASLIKIYASSSSAWILDTIGQAGSLTLLPFISTDRTVSLPNSFACMITYVCTRGWICVHQRYRLCYAFHLGVVMKASVRTRKNVYCTKNAECLKEEAYKMRETEGIRRI